MLMSFHEYSFADGGPICWHGQLDCHYGLIMDYFFNHIVKQVIWQTFHVCSSAVIVMAKME